ncbi:hypothetical protein [Lysinibacillus capsici]|uniref:hypothetical protein n=1 Tax=Lysinibacillus capsici TaxID=2115968 RepID=UPI002A829308|nr:hypothetical protein [Lysinibacillus capsici]
MIYIRRKLQGIIGTKNDRRFVVEEVDYAVQVQNPTPALIIYTDLGTQYTSETFQEKLKKHEMIPSFSVKVAHTITLVSSLFSRHRKKKKSIERALKIMKQLK